MGKCENQNRNDLDNWTPTGEYPERSFFIETPVFWFFLKPVLPLLVRTSFQRPGVRNRERDPSVTLVPSFRRPFRLCRCHTGSLIEIQCAGRLRRSAESHVDKITRHYSTFLDINRPSSVEPCGELATHSSKLTNEGGPTLPELVRRTRSTIHAHGN